MVVADGGNAVRHGATAIEMDEQDGFCPRRYRTLYKGVIDLQRMDAWLNQYGFEPVLRDRKDRRNVSIGRNDDLVAVLQPSQFFVSSEDERQGIEPVAAADAIRCTDILCVIGFKPPRRFALQIPATLNNLLHGGLYFGLMLRRNFPQREIGYWGACHFLCMIVFPPFGSAQIINHHSLFLLKPFNSQH